MSDKAPAITTDTTPIYYRVSPALWRNRTWTDDMRLLACYLLTSPHRTLEGLFIIPRGYISGDLQWPLERLGEPFALLASDGFVDYDEAAEVCLIVKALKYQKPENPNMMKAALRRVATVPATPLDGLLLASAERFASRFAERLREGLPERFGKPQLCSSSTLLSSTLGARATPVDNSAPVDNSPGQERGGSIDQEEQGQEPSDPGAADPPATDAAETCGPESCDGAECCVRAFPASAVEPLRKAMLASLHPEQFDEVGKGGDLDRLLEEYALHFCAACQAALGEFARPQLDGMCERAIVEGVTNLKGSADVKGVIRSRLQRFGLAELVGDRVLEELRRTKREKRRKGDPKPVGECLPPGFAQPMPKPSDEQAAS